MGVWLGPMGAGSWEGKAPVFTVEVPSGTDEWKIGQPGIDYYYKQTPETGVAIDYWEIALIKDCKITFTKVGKVDYTLIGAGERGGSAVCTQFSPGYNCRGGSGGNGGKYLRETGIALKLKNSYEITIGNSASALTSGFDNDTESNQASNGALGGAGGSAWQQYSPISASAGGSGIKPYEHYDSILYPTQFFCAGGGGGGARNNPSKTGSLDAVASSGGNTGGGNGGNETYHSGTNGTFYGAGGGGAQAFTTDITWGAYGSQGIILIRNHHEPPIST